MSLSSITVQQREKEAKSLKSFLAFSLIGSLTLHVGLLASGIFSLLSRTPDLTEEPLEVVVVDPPKVEEVKPKPEPQPQRTQPPKAAVSPGSSRIGSQPAPKRDVEAVRKPAAPPKTTAKLEPRPQPRTAPSPAVVAEKKPTPPPKPEPTQDRQELVESLKQEPTPPKPVQAPRPVVTRTPQPLPAAPLVTNTPSSPVASAPPVRSPSIAAGSGDSNIASSGNSTSSTQQERGSGGSGSTVATGTGTASRGIRGRGSGGDEKGTGSGRLACRRCGKPEYPSSAKRRGVEGTTKVRVSVDTGGNVTDVQIAQSSGNSALDEAALRAVRRWKFEQLNRARQGVVSVNFALEGSERARLAEERQERREAARKKRGEAEEASSPQRTEAAAPRQQPQSPTPLQQAPSDRSQLMDALRR